MEETGGRWEILIQQLNKSKVSETKEGTAGGKEFLVKAGLLT